MSDVPLEIIRAIITGLIYAYLFLVGRNEEIRHQRGWTYITAGFGLIFFGTLIDISDNFPILDKYLIVGDTEYEAFLEKVVGYLSGFFLLAIGLVKWMPTVIALRHTQNELRESHNEMELKVKERTSDLKAINERLEQEITERENTADLLRKFSLAVEQGASSVIITDLDGNIEYINPRFTQLTGYTLEEAIGQNPRILKSGEHSEEFYKELWDTITSGREWRGEFHNKKKNGELFWELGSISPIRNSEGIIANFIAIKEDITDRKLAEDELKQKSQELETLTENLRKLSAQLSKEEELTRRKFAGILHEQVGQTLVAIKMKCYDVFEETFSDTSEIKRAIYNLVPILNDAIRSTRDLTSDIYPTIIDDLGFIPAVNWSMDKFLKQKELKVSLDINKAVEDLPLETKLLLFYIVQEAFQNISKHAFATEVKVKLTKVGKTLNMSIEDNGVGFDTEEIKQKRDKGIGLMLMKERSLSLGWGFKLKSASDKGTKIRIEIPIKQ